MAQHGMRVVRDGVMAIVGLRLRLHEMLILQVRMLRHGRGWGGTRVVARLGPNTVLRQHDDAAPLQCSAAIERRGG